MTSEITIMDIILIKKLIEVTSSRGSIQAQEMESVGKLYNKIIKYLEENKESLIPRDVNGE